MQQDLDSYFGRPIPASQLKEYIKSLVETKVDPNFPEINGFDIEYNKIETQTAQDQSVTTLTGDNYRNSFLSANKNKNRYSNVLPPENTRVKLKKLDGEEGTDYINANYISGLIPGSDRAYVATQGPLSSTFCDFWRMVWELNVAVVVMLTKEVENGRLKCDRYWPEYDIPLNCYPFKVTLESEEDTNELTTRKLRLEHQEENQTREVHQFQYTAWPDHGLPVSTTAFLELAERADSANTTQAPIIVHCSAGIGRSGTFCTVHSTIQQLRLHLKENPSKEPEFNIVKTILDERKQRPGMVQTKEQYMFCYLAILEEAEKLLGQPITPINYFINNLNNTSELNTNANQSYFLTGSSNLRTSWEIPTNNNVGGMLHQYVLDETQILMMPDSSIVTDSGEEQWDNMHQYAESLKQYMESMQIQADSDQNEEKQFMDDNNVIQQENS